MYRHKHISESKTANSRLIKKEFPKIKTKLWKKYFWKKGFYVNSKDSIQIDIIKNYILKQS